MTSSSPTTYTLPEDTGTANLRAITNFGSETCSPTAYAMTADNEAWISQDTPNGGSFTINVNMNPDRLGNWDLNLQATSPDCPADTNEMALVVPIEVLCTDPTLDLDPSWVTHTAWTPSEYGD